LTWEKVVTGVEETDSHGKAWGTWFCHDITAAVLRRWGLNEQVYRAAYPHTPGGRIGLVTARIAAIVLVLGTIVILDVREAWNGFQDAWNALTRW
jgi:hypothetical protein